MNEEEKKYCENDAKAVMEAFREMHIRRKAKQIAIGVSIAALAGIAGYLFGKRKGAEKLVDELMDIYDKEHTPWSWPCFKHDKTGLLYLVKVECIGD